MESTNSELKDKREMESNDFTQNVNNSENYWSKALKELESNVSENRMSSDPTATDTTTTDTTTNDLKNISKKEYIILLLGETGVGKSTFINAFANYLTYKILEQAQNEEIMSLIPTSFTITDEEYEEKVVKLGSDENECDMSGQSATQTCKSYVFQYGDNLVHLIDTPGVGDTRGVKQDGLNFENILAFIGQYSELHCICILLKPNNSRITVTFEFCIKQLLTHLEKSASNNIVFLFTNVRGTFYRPGDTAPALRKILGDIKISPPFVDIAFRKDTIYCLDNESFRFLAAIKNGISFAEDEIENFSKSWNTSVKECGRLMDYIIGTTDGKPGLKPDKTHNTITVNEARRQILRLSQPLADIAHNIEDNLKVMELKKDEINATSSNIENLKENLYIPYIDLEFTEVDRPKTVCASPDCCKIYEVGGLKKSEYIQKCHDPCSLTGVQKDILGDPGLMRCAAMSGNNCKKCGCNYAIHLHIYYESKAVEKRKEDEAVKSQINDKEYIKGRAEKIIKEIEERSKQMKSEMECITKATAKFAHFLKNNAIVAYNDSFEAYLEHLIENQQTLGNKGANNKEIIEGLQNMFKNYQKEKEILDMALAETTECGVSAEDVFKSIEELYKLKIYGEKIQKSQTSQNLARMSEMINSPKVFVDNSMNQRPKQGYLYYKFVQGYNHIWSKIQKVRAFPIKQYFIGNEEKLSNKGSNNMERVEGLRNMLNSYQMEKEILHKSIADTSECSVLAEDDSEGIERLYGLQIFGKKIQKTQTIQNSARQDKVNNPQKDIDHKPKRYEVDQCLIM